MTDKPKAPRPKRTIELTVQGDELVKKIEAQRSVRVVTLGKAPPLTTADQSLKAAIDAAVAKVEAAKAAHPTQPVDRVAEAVRGGRLTPNEARRVVAYDHVLDLNNQSAPGYTVFRFSKPTLRQRFAKLLIAIADALYRAAGAK